MTRERPPEDKRSVLVGLTETGRRRHEDRQTALATALQGALAHHGVAELAAASDVLGRLADIYDEL